VHVGLGGEFEPKEALRRYWKGNLITGVFSPKTRVRGAAEACERLHFIGFVNEKSYESNSSPIRTCLRLRRKLAPH
jgi:hypothetical protein